MNRGVLGLDIGGANLKAAHSYGGAVSQPFALWKNPQGLADELRRLLGRFDAFDSIAVTMTGELCDCYATKREGVHAILAAVSAASATKAPQIWSNRGRLLTLPQARDCPLDVAAANWLALAQFGGRFAQSGPALLIDIGSTTTDIIPLVDGCPQPAGLTDPDRLNARELVYTGARRTPLCALLGPTAAAEWFATTLDAYLVLELLPEDEHDLDTADNRPATRACAHARLARMRCSDMDIYTPYDTLQIARAAQEQQQAILREALHAVSKRLPSPPRTLIVAGSGEFLAKNVIASTTDLKSVPVFSLTAELGAERSRAACAYALAVLAAEGNHAE